MPLYDWQDKKSGKTVSIVRAFSGSADVPERGECTEFSDDEYASAEWEKQLGVGTRFMHGPNWTGRKGHW